jgi:hypothetical protein
MKYIKNLSLKNIDHFITLKSDLEKIDIKSLYLMKNPSLQDSIKYKDLFLKNDVLLNFISINEFIKKINITEEDLLYIFSNPRLSFEYAKVILRNTYSNERGEPNIDIKYAEMAEDSILKDPSVTLNYVRDFSIYRGNFLPKAEKLFATNSDISFAYAEHLKMTRGTIWTKGEDAISESPEYSYKYGREILNGRFEKGEKAIASDVNYAYDYAFYLKEYKNIDWKGGEDIISKNAGYSYKYAMYVIKGRWEKGEEAISKSHEHIYQYAVNVLNDKFDLGHHTIFNTRDNVYSHNMYKDMYIDFLKKKKYKFNNKGEIKK